MSQVNKLYDNMLPTNELEFILFNYNKKLLSLDNYTKTLDYLKFKSKKSELDFVKSDMLDINYADDYGTIYRITIDDINTINKNLNTLSGYKNQNHSMFNFFLNKIKKGGKSSENITLLKKIKNKENVVDINDYNIRVRLSEERNPTKEEMLKISDLDYTKHVKIGFRLKNRISCFVYGKESSKTFVKIDITTTKTTSSIAKLNDVFPVYEVEVEIGIEDVKIKKKLILLMWH